MRRIKIVLSYDGTDYHGWQVQPGLPTIQAVVEQVVAEIEGCAVNVTASGRTDAGVHALAQVAAFDLTNPIPAANLRKAMNRLLPRDIRVLSVEETRPDFHPRYDAKAKTYEYRIWRGEIVPPFVRRYVHHHPYHLDTGGMAAAAPVLEGTHDLTAFAAADERDALGLSKIRTVFCSRVEIEAERVLYRVRGSGFLKHMVRNIVGVLLELGKGSLGADGVRARLDPGCGIPPGPTAPAQGLFLVDVEY